MSGYIRAYEDDYIIALSKAHEDAEAFEMIESFIRNHFIMIRHMKETSLYDVFEYEEKLNRPLEILAYDNEKLKKEVNDLRKQLGLGKKYKIIKWRF